VVVVAAVAVIVVAIVRVAAGEIVAAVEAVAAMNRVAPLMTVVADPKGAVTTIISVQPEAVQIMTTSEIAT